MKQALIIKNPKWEPFHTVSDAFKATAVKEGETAILVVRGRCKEKNLKTMKPLKSGKTAEWLKQNVEVAKKLAGKVAVALLLTIGVSAFAQQDITASLGARTSIITSDATPSQPFTAQPGDVISVQVTAKYDVLAGNGVSNIVFSCDQQLGGNYWHTNAFTLSFPVNTTNNAARTSIVKTTNTLGGISWRVGNVTCGATNAVTIVEAKYYLSRP